MSSGTTAGHLVPLLNRLANTAGDGGARLVFDVSDVILNDLDAVKEFVAGVVQRGSRHSIRVVARRGTARALLRRLGGSAISVHPSVDLALADGAGPKPIGAEAGASLI